MNLTNMKMSSSEREDESMLVDSDEDYPWGLRVHLDSAAMSKLNTPAKIGDKLMLVAMVNVTNTTEYADASGSSNSMSLQITDMALESARDSDDRLARMFKGE